MRKIVSALLLIVIALSASLIVSGCGAGTGNGTTTGTTDISGEWSGSWGSYNDGGATGAIDLVSISSAGKADNTVTSQNLSGSLSISGMNGMSSGTLTGTLTGNTVSFTVTFSSGSSLVFEGTKVGDSINGSYKRYDSSVQTDGGTFLLNRKTYYNS